MPEAYSIVVSPQSQRSTPLETARRQQGRAASQVGGKVGTQSAYSASWSLRKERQQEDAANQSTHINKPWLLFWPFVMCACPSSSAAAINIFQQCSTQVSNFISGSIGQLTVLIKN
ncbi:unnamed protein product [Urochloa decumbens]|uniref:Uncharacterized protein n=1 Tax=Urochloa decumbens TaxID=240449 RepID=A0ABC9FPR5_9POAL